MSSGPTQMPLPRKGIPNSPAYASLQTVPSAPHTCLLPARGALRDEGAGLQATHRATSLPTGSLPGGRPARAAVSTGLLSPGGGRPLPCAAPLGVQEARQAAVAEGCPLTSGNRRTLQYFTPLRSLGAESGGREHPREAAGRQGSTPPTLLTL